MAQTARPIIYTGGKCNIIVIKLLVKRQQTELQLSLEAEKACLQKLTRMRIYHGKEDIYSWCREDQM